MFRAKQMNQDKAQAEDNGMFLVQGCNAVLGHLLSSLRASRALRPSTSRLAEHGNITLKEY